MRTIRGVTVYPSPDAPALHNTSIVVQSGRITEIGPGVASAGEVLDFPGAVVVAGFWNAHVHLTEPKWAGAARATATQVERMFAEMFLRRGFTSVVDTGSDPRTTLPLRARLRSGELFGPTLFTSGTGLYPPRGIPYYLAGSLPWYAPWFMPQPRRPAAAARAVRRGLRQGIDLVKLFTGSYVAPGRVRPMPLEVAGAAVATAHADRRPVFAHASNREGVDVAVASGVDVLAHAPDATEGIDTELVRRIVDRRMAMIPTLKMFGTTVTKDPAYLGPIVDIVREFHRQGGEILFGTDVGYMTDYSTDGEFEALRDAGLDGRAILRALTTAPAARFGVRDRGTVVPGQVADLVVLDGDPTDDPRAFARVRATFRDGRPLTSPGG